MFLFLLMKPPLFLDPQCIFISSLCLFSSLIFLYFLLYCSCPLLCLRNVLNIVHRLYVEFQLLCFVYLYHQSCNISTECDWQLSLFRFCSYFLHIFIVYFPFCLTNLCSKFQKHFCKVFVFFRCRSVLLRCKYLTMLNSSELTFFFTKPF